MTIVLRSVYNAPIKEAGPDPAVLAFVHDGVYLTNHSSAHWHDNLKAVEIVGLVVNRYREWRN